MGCGGGGGFFGRGCGRGLLGGPGCLVYVIGVVITSIFIMNFL